MSKYPLDQEALVEEYGDLLIKIALKAYMKEQAQLLEQEEAEAAPVPAPKGNVVAAAFRQVNQRDDPIRAEKGRHPRRCGAAGCSHHLHHGLCGLGHGKNRRVPACHQCHS